MSKRQTKSKGSAAGQNKPRQVRMPPALDQWLEERAAKSGHHTVADIIRDIVAKEREASLQQEQAA